MNSILKKSAEGLKANKIGTLFLSLAFIVLHLHQFSLFSQEEYNFMKSSNLTGDWSGNRSAIDEIGISLEIVYKAEIWSGYGSEVAIGSSYIDNLDLIFSFDLDKLIGLDNTIINTYFLSNQGQDFNSKYIKSIQGISNIEAPQAWKLYNINIERTFDDGDLSILFGTYDYNSEFDVKNKAANFINPSHGIGADIAVSGENGPSIFPTASLGIRAKYDFQHGIYAQTVILDGVPGNPDNARGTFIILDKNEGLFISTEIGITSEIENDFNNKYFKLAGGYWHYTDNYLSLLSKIKNFGAYLLGEYEVFREDDYSQQGLSMFARVGFADRYSNSIDYFVGSGIVYCGLIPGRDEDELGIAFSTAHDPHHTGSGEIPTAYQQDNLETIFELYYGIQITNSIALQPDLQYVISPCVSDDKCNLIVGGARLKINI